MFKFAHTIFWSHVLSKDTHLKLGSTSMTKIQVELQVQKNAVYTNESVWASEVDAKHRLTFLPCRTGSPAFGAADSVWATSLICSAPSSNTSKLPSLSGIVCCLAASSPEAKISSDWLIILVIATIGSEVATAALQSVISLWIINTPCLLNIHNMRC